VLAKTAVLIADANVRFRAIWPATLADWLWPVDSDAHDHECDVTDERLAVRQSPDLRENPVGLLTPV